MSVRTDAMGGRRRFRIGSNRWPTWLMVIAGAAVTFAVVIPTVVLLLNSLRDDDGGWTLQAYVDTLSKPSVASALLNTGVVVVGSTLLAVVTGVILAWVVSRTDVPARRLLSIVPVMPLFLPPVVGAVAWVLLAAPRSGLLNVGIRLFTGGVEGPLNIYSIWGVTWVIGIYITPYVYLMIANAFKQFDGAFEEAARSTGASLWNVMSRVSLPLLRPAILAGALLAFVSAMAQFAIPEILGKSDRVYVLTTLIYDYLRVFPRDTKSAAVLSAVMLVITVGTLWYQRRLLRQSERFVTLAGKGVRQNRLSLGRWRWWVFSGMVTYVVVTVVLPVVALINVSLRRFWSPDLSITNMTGRNFVEIFGGGYSNSITAIVNSVKLSVVGATIGMLLAALIGYVVVQSTVKGRAFLDYMATLPAAIPATVLGAGLLMVYLGPPIALYGSSALLILAYVANFLPHGSRTANAGFHQISREMDESAAICGSPWLTTFRRVTLPLLAPSLAGGWVFLFILMSREVSTSVMVASPGTPVISLVVLDLWANGHVPRLAAYSVGVLVLSTAFTMLAIRFGAVGGARS